MAPAGAETRSVNPSPAPLFGRSVGEIEYGGDLKLGRDSVALVGRRARECEVGVVHGPPGPCLRADDSRRLAEGRVEVDEARVDRQPLAVDRLRVEGDGDLVRRPDRLDHTLADHDRPCVDCDTRLSDDACSGYGVRRRLIVRAQVRGSEWPGRRSQERHGNQQEDGRARPAQRNDAHCRGRSQPGRRCGRERGGVIGLSTCRSGAAEAREDPSRTRFVNLS